MLCTASIPGTPGTYFEHVVCSSHEAVLSTRRQYVAQQSRYVLSKWCVFMVYHVPEDHTVVMYFYQLSANCWMSLGHRTKIKIAWTIGRSSTSYGSSVLYTWYQVVFKGRGQLASDSRQDSYAFVRMVRMTAMHVIAMPKYQVPGRSLLIVAASSIRELQK